MFRNVNIPRSKFFSSCTVIKVLFSCFKPLYYPVSIFNAYVQYFEMQLNILQFQTCHCIKFCNLLKKFSQKRDIIWVVYLKFPTLEQWCGWVVNCVHSTTLLFLAKLIDLNNWYSVDKVSGRCQ